ncbi:hypothetical protein [Salinibacter sp.]|uniref:hypothetical protein n=1 Tax=Salinibacter sp. TaxID=2065818 RepID=UPI0021E8A0BB|nr:hypothetical protein [Salinibacter sp.]
METTLIAPVGTSLFGNYIDGASGTGSVTQNYGRIENEPGDRWAKQESRIEEIQQDRDFRIWIEATEDASAEIESARKIASQAGGPITVRLLASDTIESRLAAELIRDCSGSGDIEFKFNAENDQISELQVFDNDRFKDGIRNLVRRVRSILENKGELVGRESGGTCAINITGGYKATLPYLTVLGELYDVPLHYKFEDADGQLSIPQLPITLDEEIFQKYETEFAALSDGVEDWSAFREEHGTFARRARELVEVAGNVALLSPLGELFWGYYTDQYVFFYAPDETHERIQGQPNVRRILQTKMKQLRGGSQIGPKGDHLAFDDGNNSNRIFLFEDEGRLYVYQTFDEEGGYDDYDTYWRETSFTKRDRKLVKEQSSRRRLRRGDR